MSRVRSGVSEMLGELFDRYHVALFNFYCRLTGNRTASEDMVQDVFYRILKYRESFQPGMAFRAWMYQIARNVRTDHIKKIRPEVTFEPEHSPSVVPIDTIHEQQQTTLLHRALMQLPEPKREVLVLSRFQELKYDEIATLLGCEVGAVKVRVHRALHDLQQIYRELERGGAPSGSLSAGK